MHTRLRLQWAHVDATTATHANWPSHTQNKTSHAALSSIPTLHPPRPSHTTPHAKSAQGQETRPPPRRRTRGSRPPHDAVTRTDGEARPRQNPHRLANTHSHRLRTEATSIQRRSPIPDSVQSSPPHRRDEKAETRGEQPTMHATQMCPRRSHTPHHAPANRRHAANLSSTPPSAPPPLQRISPRPLRHSAWKGKEMVRLETAHNDCEQLQRGASAARRGADPSSQPLRSWDGPN